MDTNNVILISEKDEDVGFFGKLPSPVPLKVYALKSWRGLEKLILALRDPLLFWNVDGGAIEGSISPDIKTIPVTVLELLTPERSFALTSKPISQYPEFFHAPPYLWRYFRHNLMRHYTMGAAGVYSRMIPLAITPATAGLQPYFPEGTQIQQITIKSTKHRTAAVEAVHSLLNKKGFNSRLAARVAQSTDELMMNAIFDAAWDKSSNTYTRHQMDRKATFELPGNERVLLELAETDEYFGVCVTDFFGSLSRDKVMNFLSQDFHTKDYMPRKNTPAAGLGLYGVVQTGLSLIYACQHATRTDAILLFPKAASYKDFKQGFQVLGYFDVKKGPGA